jgi:hypothetical protein
MRPNFLLIVIAAFIFFCISCRKTDKPLEEPPHKETTTENRFFNTNRTSNPIENKLVSFLRSRNELSHFVEKTVDKIGFPRWDKLIAQSNNSLLGRSSSDSVNVFYIPFVRNSQNHVNASLVIRASATDTSFSYLCDWQYHNRQNSDNSLSDSAEHFAILFMQMDRNVFGHTKFNITDSNLFRHNNHRALYVILPTIPTSTSGRNALTQYCDVATIFYEDCKFPGYPECTPYCDLCYRCTASVSFQYCWQDDGNGSGGGGDDGSGGTGGSGGGSGGGETPPDCGPTGGRTMIRDDCDSGWEPIDPNLFKIDYLSNVMGLSLYETDWLSQNTLVVSDLYDALQGSLTEVLLPDGSISIALPSQAIIASNITLKAAMNGIINGPYNTSSYNSISSYLPNAQNYPTIDPAFWAYFSVQCSILKSEHPDWSNVRVYWEAMQDIVHLGLDVIGLFPVVGEVADLANGVIYTIQGDGLNAALSYASAIPIAGWATASVKFAKRALTALDGSTRTLKWIKQTNGLIHFGDRSLLRKVLGLATGDVRVAHHIIPWEKAIHPAVQKAAKGSNPFHLNEILNGIPLNTSVHTGNHAAYLSRVQSRLDAIPSNLDANQTRVQIEQIIIDIKNAIANNPNTHIDNLIF